MWYRNLGACPGGWIRVLAKVDGLGRGGGRRGGSEDPRGRSRGGVGNGICSFPSHRMLTRCLPGVGIRMIPNKWIRVSAAAGRTVHKELDN